MIDHLSSGRERDPRRARARHRVSTAAPCDTATVLNTDLIAVTSPDGFEIVHARPLRRARSLREPRDEGDGSSEIEITVDRGSHISIRWVGTRSTTSRSTTSRTADGLTNVPNLNADESVRRRRRQHGQLVRRTRMIDMDAQVTTCVEIAALRRRTSSAVTERTCSAAPTSATSRSTGVDGVRHRVVRDEHWIRSASLSDQTHCRSSGTHGRPLQQPDRRSNG